ncbi:hypothetical protein V6C32_02865 [Desulforamulus ruminis]|uniref:Uncharacterized protein n=1 Tax=Desulforamulus ruminis (strain ATCC 23193 / DSM 2154 / NCIMB 8452 / DL) TaxID=696281 RepID=F6DV16_DESRL|nr:hypothetical protein [Desulforamulus ruminis]AEG61413.1 hypothetical protein Desru_3204 [Desulforamulus ruminis DSM 2154]
MFGSIALANPAQGDTFTLTPEQVKLFKEKALQDGIDEVTQEKLLKKLEKGELLDCMNPEKIKQAQKNTKLTIDKPRAEYTFEDGSKWVTEITILDSNKTKDIGPMVNLTRDVKVYQGSSLYLVHLQ